MTITGPQPDEPNYYVLIAPGSDSDDPMPDWVDVSTWLRSVTVRRGADKHLDEDQPGEATFVLDNYDGTWDNDNTQSPYAGQLITDMRVRVLAEWDGDLHERFNGYLDDIELDYPDGDAEAWATFRATDAFKVLEGATLPSSAFVAEVLADQPVAFWRLDEPEGSTVVYDSAGAYDLDVSGTPEFGQASLVAREPGTAVLTTSGAGQSIGRYVTGGLPAPGPPITIETVFRRTVDGADGGMGGIMCDPLTHGMFALLTSSTVVAAQAVNGANAQQLVNTTGVDLDDNLTHHLVARWAASGALKIFVDGVDRTSGAPTLATTAFTDTSAFVFANGFFGDPDTGIQQMCAIYNTELSDERIAEHAACVSTPWDGDIPSQRAHRVCDVIGWPEELRDFEEGLGQTTLQSAELGMTALQHLLTVAASEFGELHVTKEGAIKLVARHSLINRDPLAEFGPADDEVRYRAIRFSSGADLVRNPVTVSRLDGLAQTAEAPAGYYPHQFTLDGLYHDSDELSRSAAQFLLSEFKDQKRRITGLTFGPFDAERLFDWFPLLLEAELGDVYQVTFTPPNGDDLVQLCVLEGTDESWSAETGVGDMSWSLSRAYAGSFWQLGVHGRSELGLTTRLYF